MPAAKEGEVQREMLLPDEVRSYVKKHNIDQIITTALNNVIKQQPLDPIGHLAGELARKSTSPPRFDAIRSDMMVPRSELRFVVVMATRGVHARLHSFSLEGVLQASEAPAEGTEAKLSAEPDSSAAAATAALVDTQREEESTVAFLEEFFHKAFKDASIDEFLTFHERCQDLCSMPRSAGAVLDMPHATAVITDELMVAAARSLNVSRLDFLQRMLERIGVANLASPPLCTHDDIVAWRPRWPRLAMSLFHGGSPSSVRPASLRVCAALGPTFGVAGVAANGAFPECPALGWVTTAVHALREMGLAAARELQKEKATAAMVVEGVAHCPGSLERALELAQKFAEAAGAGGSHQQRPETSGVLLAAAEEAWLDEEGVYEIETGKKLTLEQLVDFYDNLAKTGWLRMIVDPFRQADALAGCDLLHARRPQLRLVVDFGDAESPPAPKGAAYSCTLALADSAPATLQRYAGLVPQWSEADGCGRYAWLRTAAARYMHSALEVALACRQTEVIGLFRDIADEDVLRMSERIDDVLHSALFPADLADQDAQ